MIRDRSLDGVPDDVSAKPSNTHKARQTLDLSTDRARRKAKERPASRLRLVKGSLRLPTELESVPAGRSWLRDVLAREFGDGHPAIGNALQALSEILTNAVLYGTGLHVRVTYALAGEWAEVAVHNDGRSDGSRPQKQPPAAPDAESGRGLELVEAFSDHWGITMLPHNEVKVWFRVRFT